jgi:hypothetical protein
MQPQTFRLNHQVFCVMIRPQAVLERWPKADAVAVLYSVQRVRRRGNRARRKGGFAGLIGVDRSAARRADWQADIAHGDNRRHARAVWPTVRHEVPLQRRQPIERPHCSGVPLWQVPPAVIFVLPSHWPRACRLFGP